jgi:hypothetical protein
LAIATPGRCSSMTGRHRIRRRIRHNEKRTPPSERRGYRTEAGVGGLGDTPVRGFNPDAPRRFPASEIFFSERGLGIVERWARAHRLSWIPPPFIDNECIRSIIPSGARSPTSSVPGVDCGTSQRVNQRQSSSRPHLHHLLQSRRQRPRREPRRLASARSPSRTAVTSTRPSTCSARDSSDGDGRPGVLPVRVGTRTVDVPWRTYVDGRPSFIEIAGRRWEIEPNRHLRRHGQGQSPVVRRRQDWQEGEAPAHHSVTPGRESS